MGVYIKGMEMPTSCARCCLDGFCKHWDIVPYRHEDCPLLPVPDHGRLIDADALCKLCDIMADKCDGIGESIWHQFRTTVEWSPTIIEAEEGE